MNFRAVINKRRSVRKFGNKTVDFELVNKALEIARKCPSAGAIRGYETFVIIDKLVHISAPAYVVICANSQAYEKRYGERGRNLYAIQDATILGAYFQLALVDMGMVSVWVGAFREGKVKRHLNTEFKPVVVIAMGYPTNEL